MIDCSKTENYFNEKLRMTKRTKNGLCEIKCSNCPLCSNRNGEGLPCPEFEMFYPEKAIEIVQKWSDAHSQKTYFTELLRNYPNVELNGKGFPKFCPCKLGYQIADEICSRNACSECWNLPIEDGESE